MSMYEQPAGPDWWMKGFGRDYILLEGHRWEYAKSGVDFIERALGLSPQSSIIDLGCGNGRISIELAKRGHDVTGLDYSRYLLGIAKRKARSMGVRVDFLEGDMRKLGYQASFDAAVSWGGTFGFFSDEENVDVLRGVARALRLGGKYLVDLHNRDGYIIRHLGKKWHRRGDTLILEDWRFDLSTSRLIIEHEIHEPSRKPRRGVSVIREYTIAEISEILSRSGLQVTRLYGDLADQVGLRNDSIQLVCRKHQSDPSSSGAR